MAEKAATSASAKPPKARAKKAPTPTRIEREAERRKLILRAAVEVFSRKGYLGCRIQDVAKEAGVAYGLVYHYFKNKDELLESVFASGWQGFLGRIEAALHKEAPLAERVRGMVHVAFEAYRRDPRGVKVLILEVGRSPAGGAVNRGSAFTGVILSVAQVFAEAQEKGELDKALDPTMAATMLFGCIEVALTAFVMGMFDRKDDAVIERSRDQVARMFLNGLLSRP